MGTLSVKVTGIIRRTLAFVVDYLIFSILYLLFGSLVRSISLDFLVAFFCGAAYFSLTAGTLASRSLGKRIFGLRVVHLRGGELSLTLAFYRFFFSYGLLILASEAPSVLLREFTVSATPELLELHMAFVMAYCFANGVLSTFGPGSRGIHDLVCGTQVLPDTAVLPVTVSGESEGAATKEAWKVGEPKVNERQLSTRLSLALAGSVVGVLFWILGLPQEPAIRSIVSRKYQIEKVCHARIGGMRVEGVDLAIDMLLLPGAEEITEAKLKPFIADISGIVSSSDGARNRPDAVSSSANAPVKTGVKDVVFRIYRLDELVKGDDGKASEKGEGEQEGRDKVTPSETGVRSTGGQFDGSQANKGESDKGWSKEIRIPLRSARES